MYRTYLFRLELGTVRNWGQTYALRGNLVELYCLRKKRRKPKPEASKSNDKNRVLPNKCSRKPVKGLQSTGLLFNNFSLNMFVLALAMQIINLERQNQNVLPPISLLSTLLPFAPDSQGQQFVWEEPNWRSLVRNWAVHCSVLSWPNQSSVQEDILEQH